MSTSRVPSLLLSGRLEALCLGDVLQMLARNDHSGVLDLEQDEGGERGEIEIIHGRIVRADIHASAARLGSLLQDRGHVGQGEIDKALRRQSTAAAWKPLGSVLLEMGAIDPTDLADSLVEQIERNAAVMLGWERGVFRFRAWGTCTRTGLAPEVGVAVEPHELLLEAARLHDEAQVPALHH